MIVPFSKLPALRQKLAKEKVVLGAGTFDLLHAGHVSFLKHLKRLGGVVVIAVASDDRVRQRKGSGRPIVPAKDRLRVVDAMRYVDYCYLAPRPSRQQPVPTIQGLKKLQPDLFVSNDKNWLPHVKQLRALGVDLHLKLLPRVAGKSTTRTIRTILNRKRLLD